MEDAVHLEKKKKNSPHIKLLGWWIGVVINIIDILFASISEIYTLDLCRGINFFFLVNQKLNKIRIKIYWKACSL